jgi:hypothetical protein
MKDFVYWRLLRSIVVVEGCYAAQQDVQISAFFARLDVGGEI